MFSALCVSNVLQLFDGSFCHLWSRGSLPGGEFDQLFDGFAQMGSVSRFHLIRIFITMCYNTEYTSTCIFPPLTWKTDIWLQVICRLHHHTEYIIIQYLFITIEFIYDH